MTCAGKARHEDKQASNDYGCFNKPDAANTAQCKKCCSNEYDCVVTYIYSKAKIRNNITEFVRRPLKYLTNSASNKMLRVTDMNSVKEIVHTLW